MVLKPQDILVTLKLLVIEKQNWNYASLATEIGMSPSQVHTAIKRAIKAKLAIRNDEHIIPVVRNLEEFLAHGIQYVFVPERGDLTRGIPTSHAAPPLKKYFVTTEDPPPVWPDPEGTARGIAFSPLYKQAPEAAASDNNLYELLALVDAIRGGRAREKSIALKELKLRFSEYG